MAETAAILKIVFVHISAANCLILVPFKSLGAISYSPSIVNGRIFSHFGVIQRQIMA